MDNMYNFLYQLVGEYHYPFILKNVNFCIVNKIIYFHYGHYSYLWLYYVEIVMCVISMKFYGDVLV